MVIMTNRFTRDLEGAFPVERFIFKKTGGSYILYHTLETRNMSEYEYSKLQFILSLNSDLVKHTTLIFDEGLTVEKLRAGWKEEGVYERA